MPEMIASAIMPHIYFEESCPDLARAGRPCRHRLVGGIVVSAEIIQFIPRPKWRRQSADGSIADFSSTDFPTIAFRSVRRADDLVMDHVDTAPCDYVASGETIGHGGK